MRLQFVGHPGGDGIRKFCPEIKATVGNIEFDHAASVNGFPRRIQNPAIEAGPKIRRSGFAA